MNVFVALSENDKRLIFAVLIVFVLVFVLIGYLGFLVTKIMKAQGKKLDHYVADPVVTRVITDKKHFISYARKKNWRIFFKQAYIPILLMLIGVGFLLLRDGIMSDFAYNPFNKNDGFGTILFLWDFSVCFTKGSEGLIVKWPLLVNTPHVVIEAWGGYLFTIFTGVGLIWYLVVLQCLIARTIRLYKLSTTAFEKTLEGFNQFQQQANTPPQSQPQQEETINIGDNQD